LPFKRFTQGFAKIQMYLWIRNDMVLIFKSKRLKFLKMKKLLVLSAALFIFASTINARNVMAPEKKEINTGNALIMVNHLHVNQLMNDSNYLHGNSAYASLPVYESFIPKDVVDKLVSKYGAKLYDITAIKEADNQVGYVVRLLQDGGQYAFLKVTDL
jgi:hypothetical protein